MKISIICPLYNAENYIEALNKSLLEQILDEDIILDINYVVTRSSDNTELKLIENKCKYSVIEKSEFSHSLTRENIAYSVDGDIIVFISQDIMPKDKEWLMNLVRPIIVGESEACFSRQICNNNSIEKYIRECNYPEESRVVSKDDIPKYGLLTFFFSDASSAVSRNIYVKLNGYDGKKLSISEDMYLAYKLIMNGYRIKYCSNSQIYHSHIFTLKQLYDRYYDTGIFFGENQYLNKYKANESGFKLARYVLKRSISEKNISVIFRILPDFGARFIGKYLGQKSVKVQK